MSAPPNARHLLVPFAGRGSPACRTALADLRLPKLEALLARLTRVHDDTQDDSTRSLLGIVVSMLSALLFLILATRRIVLGPEEGGVFTLFALLFLLVGLTLFGIGLLGEYIGRIYQEVRARPRYVINAVLERKRP